MSAIRETSRIATVALCLSLLACDPSESEGDRRTFLSGNYVATVGAQRLKFDFFEGERGYVGGSFIRVVGDDLSWYAVRGTRGEGGQTVTSLDVDINHSPPPINGPETYAEFRGTVSSDARVVTGTLSGGDFGGGRSVTFNYEP